MQNLRIKAIKGMAWSSLGTFSVQGISLVINIILARLLMPSDYGIIGMLAFFISISQIFIESGFGNALVQKSDRTDDDFSTIFYFNFITSVVFYLLIFISAPFIAKFYNNADLTLLTRVLSLNILFVSLSIVQQARLNINLDFKSPAYISIFSTLISGFFGILLAYFGYGIWALVIQSLAASFFRTIFLFYFNKWMPKFVFSLTSLRTLFSFSSNLLVAGFIATVVNNIYSILIGKLFSSKYLGYYTQAKQIPDLLSNTIMNIVQGVTYPILSSLQNERDRLVIVYSRLMRITMFFVVPTLTLFALLAEAFVRVFLTEKWMPVVPLIQWLCFARMITPISSLNMNILNAIGRSDLFLKVDLSKLPITAVALVVTIPLGIKAVVIGHFVSSFIAFFINAYYPGKIFGYGAIKQIKEARYIIFSTILMALIVIITRKLISNDYIFLFLGTFIGVFMYMLAAVLFKIEEFSEIKGLFVHLKYKFQNL